MKPTLAFDVYGTLINTHGVVALLETYMGEHAMVFSETWRAKQLEYSFRRGLMKQYVHFSICTKDALAFTCEHLNLHLTQAQQDSLLQSYKTLPAFDDVKKSLLRLSERFTLIAFSNGERSSVESLLNYAQIDSLFNDIVSADEISTFKPNPDIYQHLLTRTNSKAGSTWLISSNPFDVIGAKSFGLQAAWVKRSDNAVFDP
ncbi:haloacid dehalogenase type II [Psychrosphaera algicola]|uniref:(S)-2-haloacid dehalogenase n=2 Tax=Psychrosphaera TaxID=907197 RepID=A0ABT5FAU4_9GAMM|nr:haloacid dehalogenase type II [Psychrosphaera sp. G1-22]MDC2887706.1 haloacid dehalogenase type II [Psychrosphaera sp. G1-22]